MMNKRFVKVCALFLAVMLVICATPYVTVDAAPSTTAGGYGKQPTTYSKSSNSGDRDVWCTTLSGTSAWSYYTGSNTYDALSELSGKSLRTSLTTLMTSTHKKSTSYDDCKSKATVTDCENNNTSTFTTLYTSYDCTSGEFNSGNGWNREHVWPQSLGGFKTSGAGSDLHHIRPSENKTNGDRGNLKYGNVSGGSASKGNLSGIVGGYKGSYYEPLDNVKGDVARICLYVHVRYYNTHNECQSITNVFQSVDVLLDWMELDPVDTWEMGRNEVVQAIQGNRNVFIDYPEYAWMIFNKAVPKDLVTPSGMASNGNVGGNGGNGGNTTDSETETSAPSVSDGNGTLTAPLTTTQAYNANKDLAEAAFSSDAYYVKGRITEIGETGSVFKNVKITDGKTEVLIYTLSLTNGVDAIAVGDTITVHGYFKNYYGTIEMATNSSTYVQVVAKDTVAPTPTETESATVTETPTPTETESATVTEMETESAGVGESESSTLSESGSEIESDGGSEVASDGVSETVSESESESESMGDCAHSETEVRGVVSAGCADGYSGDVYCLSCGALVAEGEVKLAVYPHMFGSWFIDGSSGKEVRICLDCGAAETREPVSETDSEVNTGSSSEIESEYISESGGNVDDNYGSGCESGIAGGGIVISAIVVAAWAFVRKKKED